MIEFFKQFFDSFSIVAVGASLLCALIFWTVAYYLFYAIKSQVLGKTIWCGSRNNRTVALTFDDGPSADTEKLLDILREENLKATFFLIGRNVEKYPEIARRIVREGHQIGNHSYSHPIFLFCTPNRTRRELEKTQEIIKQATGAAPKLVRPPCGVRSVAYFSAAQALGLKTIQWSDTGFDWKKISARKIAQNVLKTVQSNSIILLHDGDSTGKSGRQATVKAVSFILKGLREKNLGIVPLAELLDETMPEKLHLQESLN